MVTRIPITGPANIRVLVEVAEDAGPTRYYEANVDQLTVNFDEASGYTGRIYFVGMKEAPAPIYVERIGDVSGAKRKRR